MKVTILDLSRAGLLELMGMGLKAKDAGKSSRFGSESKEGNCSRHLFHWNINP